jgi:hypothetical protein
MKRGLQWNTLILSARPSHPEIFIAASFSDNPTLRRGVDSGVIEETARLDESYTPIPLKHLASCQIEGSK